MRNRARHKRVHKRLSHTVGDLVEIGVGHGVAKAPVKPGAAGVGSTSRIKPHDLAAFRHLQTSANVHGGCGDDLAALDQAQLGGAAANVDVEHAPPRIERGLSGA